MKLKETIAKRICLMTICLFVINLAFASVNFVYPDKDQKNDHRLKFTTAVEDQSNETFLFEKETTEESEDFEGYVLIPFFKFLSKPCCQIQFKEQLAYSQYKFFLSPLAKWLEIRHILI